jgi:type II secretory pathway component GspD/PulD (secretin)
VPFLSKIPLLGELFKNRSRSYSKKGVLLLLTPHITEAGASPAIYNEGLMKEEGK